MGWERTVIKRLRHVIGVVSRRGPLWLQGWYWARRIGAWRDRIGSWRDRIGSRRSLEGEPNRNIPRTVPVRLVRGLWAVLGPTGWLCAVMVLAGLFYLVTRLDRGAAMVLAGTVVATAGTGVIWTRRNTVWDFGVVVECECGRDMEGEL